MNKTQNEITITQIHKEIDLIQNCIERMAKNSFSCKGWNLTLIAGTFALVSEKVNKWYICIVILSINLCFWWLDSFFVLQEQKFRDKYEWVIIQRTKGNTDYLYDLNPNNTQMNLHPEKKRSLRATAISPTILPMYGGITLLITAFTFFKIFGGI